MKRIQAYEGENLHSDFSFLEAESDDFFSTEDWDVETDFGTDWIDAVEAADAFDADSVTREKDNGNKKKADRKRKKSAIALIAAVLVLILTVGICGYMQTGAGPVSYVDSGDPHSLGSLRGVESSLTLKNKYMTADMVRKVNKVRDLSYLSFVNCAFEEGALDELEGALDELRLSPKNNTLTLRFDKCSGMDDLDVLQELGDIYELYINNCDITNVTFPDMSGVTVRNLTVSNCQGISRLSLNAGALYSIDLSGSGINDISFLSGADMLEKISLAHTKVTDL